MSSPVQQITELRQELANSLKISPLVSELLLSIVAGPKFSNDERLAAATSWWNHLDVNSQHLFEKVAFNHDSHLDDVYKILTEPTIQDKQRGHFAEKWNTQRKKVKK